MIAKAIIGKSFEGCVRYVMSKPGMQLLGAHGVRQDSTSSIIKDFNIVRRLRPNITNVVWHTSISFAYQDDVNDNLMQQIAFDYLEKMGLSKNQYLIVKHIDAKHKHFHIVSSRVGFDGSLVTDQWCKNRSAKASDELEQKYGLVVAQEINRVSNTVHNKITLKKQLKEVVRKCVEDVLAMSSTLEVFRDSLQEQGIEVLLQEQSTGRINGISFKSKDIAVKGSALHKSLSYKKVLARIDENKKLNSKYERRIKNRTTF